ncbi:MAG: enoyl-CoA hydratase/isomerase family protein [Deltaproteobacteria bacterium]|nr:enoyl-CoA hydratase/isomerase family protein [Deltaproteobacteria bacterium]
MNPNVETHTHGAARVIVLRRPERANAYNDEMLAGIENALASAIDDPSVSAIVFRGAGDRHFCSGADLDALRARDPLTVLDLPSARLFAAIASFPKATIAAVNGAAVGGGCELAVACDLRVLSRDAFFQLPETGLGLIPAAGGIHRLPALIGLGRAKEMIFTGRRVDADTSLAWGLANDVCAPEDLDARASALATTIAEKDIDAIALAKKTMSGAHASPAGPMLERLAQTLLGVRPKS